MIIDIISSLGFPIALVIALLWFIFQVYKKSEKREDKLMEVITNTTISLERISERLAIVEDDVKDIKDRVSL